MDLFIVKTVDGATSDHVVSAGALLVGCGVNVKVPFGGARTHQMARWVSQLPPLAGIPAGVFCAYSSFPVFFSDAVARTAETLNELSMRLEATGATVAAQARQRMGLLGRLSNLEVSLQNDERTPAPIRRRA